MNNQKTHKKQPLEQAHKRLFKERPEFLKPDADSLEQPYAGEIVDAITTYSVHEAPISDE